MTGKEGSDTFFFSVCDNLEEIMMERETLEKIYWGNVEDCAQEKARKWRI